MENRVNFKIKFIRIALSLLVIAIVQFLLNANIRLADFYFHRWYVSISKGLRYVLGNVPFSIGDVIYTTWIIIGIVFLFKIVFNAVRVKWREAAYILLQAVHSVLHIYLAFLLLWGYNYQRNSVEEDFNLPPSAHYDANSLYRLSDTLVNMANGELEMIFREKLDRDLPKEQLFGMAAAAYDRLATENVHLNYTYTSIKPSLYNKWLNYIGVTGYLNPFTNEAQVNTSVPGFTLPFTTCHEIAHQLGYAPEEDANFVGFVVASQSKDPRFRYSAHFEMLLYSVRMLGRQNDSLAQVILEKTLPGIREDYKTLRTFYENYQGPVDDYSRLLYDQYLKANQQEMGVQSYSEVVRWLLVYYGISAAAPPIPIDTLQSVHHQYVDTTL
ncbi:hypothetical protein COR50_12005 [Chitinophaga caeni]|uniref:Amino acid permease n=1 Tax=Chitinophaga caeni TaxID=2029983 RepID=A0A291QUW9_9BACT|nr:DUF3810 domain-containing protein [Chitinophaga caeni]ATL47829.1 hypothetical protein COR50_12005 [Chitinophaga caeni]